MSRHPSLRSRAGAVDALLAGGSFAWLLLFPSLGIVQKYGGTEVAFVYFAAGTVAVIVMAAGGAGIVDRIKAIDGRWLAVVVATMLVGLVTALLLAYPVSASHPEPWLSRGNAEGGSDRDESLQLGVRELLAGRYPYYSKTPLQNLVTQLPGELFLAAPFVLLGNVIWQNVFWFGAFFFMARYLLADGRLATALIALLLLCSPAVLQDFVTGGDLGVNIIAILVGMVLMVKLIPDPSAAVWKKALAAALTGIALSSRLNYLLLTPVLLVALARRAGLRNAVVWVGGAALAFAAVTVPFYWHDPAGFAPLHLHNKFSMFGEVPNGGILFPALSLLFSAAVALHPANRSVGGWLIQNGMVIVFPVLILVGLATYRFGSPNFAFTDYALAGVFLGGLGAALSLAGRESF